MEDSSDGQRGDAAATIRFGPFELDVQTAELRKGGSKIRLQDQPFQILLMLLRRSGEVVLREEIRNQLWPGETVVEFDHSINAAVKRLRDALRDSAEKPRYIETLPRRGYRFVGHIEAPVSESVKRGDQSLAVGPDVAIAQAPAPGQDPASVWESTAASPNTGFMRRRRLISALVILALTALLGTLYYRHTAPARWARYEAFPEATRLANAGNYPAAFSLILRALQVIPKDARFNTLRREISHTTAIRTTPPGAAVYLKPYGDPEGQWVLLGQSPLESFALPDGYFRWKIVKQGYRVVERAAGNQGASIEFTLDADSTVPSDMVRVPAGDSNFGLKTVHLDDYWIDQYEVTNRQYKAFVQAGGYRKQQYWREAFDKDGRLVTWEQAMTELRDSTGRPGPSTWEIGDYPLGRDDFPVNGVSWYEAAAYAEFAGKQLPTVYHWSRAAGKGVYSDILLFSNFNGSGPEQVGSRLGTGTFGTYDMAGNVKEWCRNATGDRRYILGGGWNEGRAYYAIADARSPFQRSPADGFRCVKYPAGELSESLTQPVEKQARDYRTELPASDDVFRVLKNFYAYDRTALRPATESVDQSSAYWRMEKVSFDAAYEHQRVTARLYLPKNGKPPYQVIIYYPAGYAELVGQIDEAEVQRFEFLVRGDRAVLFPVYQGTYERRLTNPPGPNSERDLTIQQCKDLLRSVDYLVTRPDIVRDGIGFFGVSRGTDRGMITLAQETRIRAAVLAEAGFASRKNSPETDGINFAPRVRVPVLMLNGRYDLLHQLDTDQDILFRLLGTPSRDKGHVLFETGHYGPPRQYVRETLDWFDRYLGPVDKFNLIK